MIENRLATLVRPFGSPDVLRRTSLVLASAVLGFAVAEAIVVAQHAVPEAYGVDLHQYQAHVARFLSGPLVDVPTVALPLVARHASRARTASDSG